jgi:serine protease Do
MRVFFSVVLVRGYDLDGGLAYGTGIVMGENKVATNCHVLRRTTQAWISQAEDVYKVVSVQADPRHDLCVLNTETMPLKPVPLGNTSALGKGDEVITLGHSNGVLTPMSSGGQVKSIYPFDHGNVIRTNARFSLGASGSPLFDGQGRLVGINTFKTPGRSAYFYAMPIEWLATIEKLPAQTKLPISGQAFWELPDDEKPFFMQIALPHLNEDWAKLFEISQRWVKLEPQDSEAWYELGAAEEGLGRTENAIESFRKAVALNPKHGDALFRLGVFASNRGDREEMRNVSITLAKIDSEMALEFNKAVGCNAEC